MIYHSIFFMRINYAKMQNRDIIHVSHLLWIIQIFVGTGRHLKQICPYAQCIACAARWGYVWLSSFHTQTVIHLNLVHYLEKGGWTVCPTDKTQSSGTERRNIETGRMCHGGRKRSAAQGGGEVSPAREVMRPHRHKADKDTSGLLSSLKSRRADHHTVNPH